MAAATYTTDLALIDDVQLLSGIWVATGGGGAALNDETDYFINDIQCISKNGFTNDTKGMMSDETSAPTITAGDAVFLWTRQANRNIMDTIANGGTQIIMGIGTSDFEAFYVDGSDTEGAVLASWNSHAVDPTQTPSATTGTPTAASNWDHFGAQWKILSSGSLKGSPNACGVTRHGREIRVVDGDVGNGFATFTAMAAFDEGITRKWGLLTPVPGLLRFHGSLVMGQSGTSTDFRDSDVSILVLDDLFVPVGFNEMSIENAGSNVEWTSIQINHLGTTSPTTLTLDVGTFTGLTCRFAGCGETTFQSTSECKQTTWINSDIVNANEADLSGSSFLTPTVLADQAAVVWAETITGVEVISELDDTTFSKGTNAHHAISFTTAVSDGADITLTGIEFTGFDADGVGDSDDSMIECQAATGTITINLIDCTVDGSNASLATMTADARAGCTINFVISPVTVTVNVTDQDGNAIENARVFVETAATIGGGEEFEGAVTSINRSGSVATVITTGNHDLETGDLMVIRGAQPDNYNTVAVATVSDATTFTYPVDDSPSTPASGTIVVSYVAIQELTTAGGVANVTRTFGAAQVMKGVARKKNTVSPFYKDGNINFTVNTSAGNTVNVTLQDDE